MSNPNLLFLFEIIVDDIKYFVSKNQEIHIKAQFSDVFDINLRCPKEESLKKGRKKRKSKRSKASDAEGQAKAGSRLEMGQAILFETSIENMKRKMKKDPLKLSVRDRHKPDSNLGFTIVPWSPSYIAYLNELQFKKDAKTSIAFKTKHKIHDSYTEDILVFLKLTTKISCFKDATYELPPPLIQDDQESTKKSFDSLLVNQELNVDEKNCPDQPFLDEHHKNLVKEDIEIENVSPTAEQKFYDRLLRELFTSGQANTQDSRPTILASNHKLYNAEVSMSQRKLTNSTLVPAKSTSFVCNKYFLHHVSRSIDSILSTQRVPPQNYLFHGTERRRRNTNFYVGYVAVKSSSSSKLSDSGKKSTEEKVNSPPSYYKYSPCDASCENKINSSANETVSLLSLDLPEHARELIKITKCSDIDCDNREYGKIMPPEDERILLELSDKVCGECSKKKQVQISLADVRDTKEEKQVGDGKKKGSILSNDLSCYCTCECTFGFVKHSTYCSICGGYETIGEEIVSMRPGQPLPFPCPIFHKLGNVKSKTSSVSSGGSPKSSKSSKSSKASKDKKQEAAKAKKPKPKKKFHFKTGFVGIPYNIGKDSKMGIVKRVPKNKGWQWDSDEIPALKYRPEWRPGACHKKFVKKLKYAKHPELEILEQKKKQDKFIKKRPLKRPLLEVTKKNGEFKITLETMKSYAKQRSVNQPPFEDRDPHIFFVGKSAEEKRLRQIQKEHRAKRLEYEQRMFIQSTFRNLCRKICHKTYAQALGITEDAEDLLLSTDEAPPPPDCTCSEDDLSSEDTDHDNWHLQFSPPNTIFKPKEIAKKILTTEKHTQYTYLDYRVKFVDKNGSPVPRFFTGPDGKQECSDLGGFWGPNHEWLEINKDGFIASDGRWAPFSFIGPGNEQIDTSGPSFRLTTGESLVIGVDGYIDDENIWRFYKTKSVDNNNKKQPNNTPTIPKHAAIKIDVKQNAPTPETKFSRYGHSSTQHSNKLGITGLCAGVDKKRLSDTLRHVVVKGANSNSQFKKVPSGKKYKYIKLKNVSSQSDYKCKHAAPSSKGILAINEHGKKIYFTASKHHENAMSSKLRAAELEKHGIKLSSYHLPCMRSFVNSEEMKKIQYQHILDHNAQVSESVQTDAIRRNERRYHGNI